MFESKWGVFFVAGVVFFAFAFLSNAVVPYLMYRDIPEQSAEELVNGNLRYQFEDLAQRYQRRSAIARRLERHRSRHLCVSRRTAT